MKKYHVFLLCLMFCFFLGDSSHVSAQEIEINSVSLDSIEAYTSLPPKSVWHSISVVVDYGEYHFFSIARKDGIYNGYLARNWRKSGGGIYTYEGYLYPEKSPRPIPARRVEKND